LALGNAGDVKPVGSGISEMRIDYGPGYRVYFMQRGPILLVLLCGGDKRTQKADIKRARALAAQWTAGLLTATFWFVVWCAAGRAATIWYPS
jgi:putative addiction module killer protein